MSTLSIVALLIAACGTKPKDDTGSTTGTTDGGATATELTFDDFIDVTVAYTGDVDSCCDLVGEVDNFWNDVNWIESTPDPNLVVATPLNGSILDFDSDSPVGDATLDLWFENDPTVGAPDYSVVSDSDGIVASTFYTCKPIAYKVSTDPALGNTVDTYELNQIEPYTKSTIVTDFNSVSSETYAIIPSLLGVSPDGDKGTIAGTAYDCGGDPIEGAQVIVRDAETGEIPQSMVIKYFVDRFPNRSQPYTSADGLWVAINVPEGVWTVELYVADDAGGHMLLGKSPAYIFPDSILISNIYTGFETGQRYPDICVL
ncbi:MAG: hypothetical protein GXP62_05530 [Oligoflexia bacterium]|nr:hypothetical protein [Oligoflexia bacterium]